MSRKSGCFFLHVSSLYWFNALFPLAATATCTVFFNASPS